MNKICKAACVFFISAIVNEVKLLKVIDFGSPPFTDEPKVFLVSKSFDTFFSSLILRVLKLGCYEQNSET